MTPAARLAAAIDVLQTIEDRHLPARMALKRWGEGARYAGSKDRAWVSGLALDTLRHRRSASWMMGAEGPRAAALATLRFAWDWSADQVAEAAGGEPHGPGALSEDEARALAVPRALDEAPPPVRGDYPDWLDPYLARVFGEDRAMQGVAMSRRAPVDLRANILKGDAGRVLHALESMGAAPAGVLRDALRIAAPQAAERAAAVENEPIFAKGWFEVQDLGSQIAAAAAGEIKGKQVLDFCAGGGGKTLALAAAMANSGQLYAYDADAKRLSEVVTRGQRAGLRNLQVRSPSDPDAVTGLADRIDLVFVDAPCTGSGTWRRHPDAKWRLTLAQLERRMAEQDAVLDAAAACVKSGGRLVYVTCSLLAEENEDRIAAFLVRAPGFSVRPALEAVAASGLAMPEGLEKLAACATPEGFLRLSPLACDTDGFFVAVMERVS